MQSPLPIALKDLPDADRPWYIFVSKPRLEPYAASKLQEQGFDVFLPLLSSWSRRNGPWQLKQAVMFPRYGFVRPAHEQQAIGPARSTPGVSHLVKFGFVLGCMAHDKVQALHAIVAAKAALPPSAPFEPGKHVVFRSGPLMGLTGIVSSVASERVQVMMSLLGKDHVVTPLLQDLALA